MYTDPTLRYANWAVLQALHNTIYTVRFCALVSLLQIAVHFPGLVLLYYIRSNAAANETWRSAKGQAIWLGLRLLDELASSVLIDRYMVPWIHQRQGNAVLSLSSTSPLAGIVQTAFLLELLAILQTAQAFVGTAAERLGRRTSNWSRIAWVLMALLAYAIQPLKLQLFSVSINQVLFR